MARRAAGRSSRSVTLSLERNWTGTERASFEGEICPIPRGEHRRKERRSRLLELNQMRTTNSSASDRVLESHACVAEQGLREGLVKHVAQQVRVAEGTVTENTVRADDSLASVLTLLEGAPEPHPVQGVDEMGKPLRFGRLARDRLCYIARHPVGGLHKEGADEPLPLLGEELDHERVQDHLVLLGEQFLSLFRQDVAFSGAPHSFPMERGGNQASDLHPVEMSSGRALLDPKLLGEVVGGPRGDSELFEDPPAGPFQDVP